MSLERCCGARVAGGVYAVTPVSPTGRRLEDFLFDPPVHEVVVADEAVPIVEAFNMRPVGVQLIELGGAMHILDWVGSENYPNVADFMEEAREYGPCRRLPKNLDFAVLGRESRLILAHANAHIRNVQDYLLTEPPDATPCPQNIAGHEPGEPNMCARFHWQTVHDGTPAAPMQRNVTRMLPALEYDAFMPPLDARPDYAPAWFAAFPIGGIEVVRDDDGDHETTAERVEQLTSLPVSIHDF